MADKTAKTKKEAKTVEGEHMSDKGGRPLKFATAEELQSKVDAYFAACIDNKKPYTITGLALSLDTSRETLCDYQARDGFSDTVKKAKLRCENYAEEMLLMGSNAAGAIFALKNYGWSDKQQVDINDITKRDTGELKDRLTQLLGDGGGGGNPGGAAPTGELPGD